MSFGNLEKSNKADWDRIIPAPRSENLQKPYPIRDRQKWDGGWVQKLVVNRKMIFDEKIESENRVLEE